MVRWCLDNPSCQTTTDNQIAQYNVSPLQPGAFFAVTASANLTTPGPHTVNFCIDAVDNAVAESNDYNNCSSLPFFVNAPDLTTRFLTMQGSPRVGQAVSFSGQIWNVGTASSTSYWLRFCHDNQNCLTQTEPATNQIGSDGSQNGLGPNTTWGTLNSDQWIPGPGDAGPHTVQFCADDVTLRRG